ncbi:sorbose reductase sou1 [Lactarius pseudohatsudake]|nr:sorbose reductase sou1 [Lactarius pseudohatsudake]
MAAPAQSESPLEKIGPTLWNEFALRDQGGAGCRGQIAGSGSRWRSRWSRRARGRLYCVDLPERPGDEWVKVTEYVRRMVADNSGAVTGRLEYVCADVRDRKVGEEIGEREGRMDVCVAAAGILNVNTNGVLYTAQAAGRQTARFGNGGSIILIVSLSGSVTNKGHAYNTSKSAVYGSMACELGSKRIQVNTLSPGSIYTSMTAAYLDTQPHLLDKWSKLNPLGRIGRPDELRGVITWLASDASTFCT